MGWVSGDRRAHDHTEGNSLMSNPFLTCKNVGSVFPDHKTFLKQKVKSELVNKI